jgi:hypothetical protein
VLRTRPAADRFLQALKGNGNTPVDAAAVLSIGNLDARMIRDRGSPAHAARDCCALNQTSGTRNGMANIDRRLIERFLESLSSNRHANKPDQSFILFIRDLREERRFKSANKEIL